MGRKDPCCRSSSSAEAILAAHIFNPTHLKSLFFEPYPNNSIYIHRNRLHRSSQRHHVAHSRYLQVRRHHQPRPADSEYLPLFPPSMKSPGLPQNLPHFPAIPNISLSPHSHDFLTNINPTRASHIPSPQPPSPLSWRSPPPPPRIPPSGTSGP